MTSKTSESTGAVLRGARLGLMLLMLCAAGLFASGSAWAEPYMAVREGYKCSKCHVNQTGGGMRTDYAKVYQGTRDSMYPGLGASHGTAPGVDLGSGRLSPYFAVTADVRSDLTYTRMGAAQTTLEFNHSASGAPSEAKGNVSCASCHSSASSGGGKRAEVYMEMDPAPDIARIVMSQSVNPSIAPREEYALIQKLPLDGYVKAGWFRLPTGLNDTFDEPFVHVNQALGATVPGLETVRGQGIEMGIEPGPFMVNLSLTNPNSLKNNPSAKRVYLQGYAVGSLGLLGMSHYVDPVSQNDGTKNIYTAIYGGTSLGRFTGLLEMDSRSVQSGSLGSVTTDKQRYGMAELDFLPSKGQNVKLLYEFFDPSRSTNNDIRDRTSLIYEPFLTPYLQARFGYRFYAGPSQADPSKADVNNATQIFAELHLLY